MNNSKIALDLVSDETHVVDAMPLLREEESKVVRIITALQEVQQTSAWRSLKELKLDDLVRSLKSKLLSEAKKDIPDTLKLRHLSGQIEWAEKYADLAKWEAVLKVELKRIRTRLYGESEKQEQ